MSNRKSQANRLMLLVLAVFAALTMAFAFHPVEAQARTVTLKEVKYKKYKGKVRQAKAKTLKKGVQTVRFRTIPEKVETGGYHFGVFKAPKKKTYTFTISNVRVTGAADDIANGSVSFYTAKGKNLRLQKINTEGGKAYTAGIATAYSYSLSQDSGVYANLPTRTAKIKLKKGQKVYLNFSVAGYAPMAAVDVTIK